jgi:ribosomal protein S18 acetylase RimI-like enzyme
VSAAVELRPATCADAPELEGLAGTLTIRRHARPTDRDAIVALHARVYPGEHGVDQSFVDDVAATLDELLARGWPADGEGIWMVERGGSIAGCLALSREGGGEGRVRFFLLSADLRGAGLGRRLLRELLETAREAPYACLTLATFSDLRAAAHLYREAGFELVREDAGPRWGREDFVYQHYRLEL